MKKLFSVIFILMCLVAVSGNAQATPITPVEFFVVDTVNSDALGIVDLDIVNVFPNSFDGIIQYRTDGGAWIDLTTANSVNGLGREWEISINLTPLSQELFSMQLLDAGGNFLTSTGTMEFNAENPTGLFDSVSILWETVNFNLDLATTPSCDKVRPVPIPAAMLLFGSGILGLLGLRKRA